MAGKDQTFPFAGDIGDCRALEPGNEIMPSANNIRTVNGERFNGSAQDMTFQVGHDDFNFREFRHGRRRVKFGRLSERP